jgi:hypothetical protein
LLKTSGRLPQNLLDAAIRADSLVDNQVIDTEQALAVLIYCQKHNVDFHHALQKTPWDSQRAQTSEDAAPQQKREPQPQETQPQPQPQEPPQSTPQPQTSVTQDQDSSLLNSLWSKVKRKTGEN